MPESVEIGPTPEVRGSAFAPIVRGATNYGLKGLWRRSYGACSFARTAGASDLEATVYRARSYSESRFLLCEQCRSNAEESGAGVGIARTNGCIGGSAGAVGTARWGDTRRAASARHLNLRRVRAPGEPRALHRAWMLAPSKRTMGVVTVADILREHRC